MRRGMTLIGLDEVLGGDAFVVHHAADGFSEHSRDGDLLYLFAIAVIGDAVGKYHFYEGRIVNALVGGAAHDAVAGNGVRYWLRLP